MSSPLPFSAFTIKFSGIVDRIVTPVEVFEAFDPAITSPTKAHPTKAIWDTGATKSVITAATAMALNLKPVGTTIVHHAGGQGLANTYLVNFVLPNRVCITGVLVSECLHIHGEVGALVGMDIIAGGDLAITNENGKTWMSFRHPSIAGIDYVSIGQQLRQQNINRNAPCPCGKTDSKGVRLKYKKCCGGSIAKR